MEIPTGPPVSRSSQRPAATKYLHIPRSREQQNHQQLGPSQPNVDIEGSAITDITHRPPTPLSESARTCNPGKSHAQATFTVFDIYLDVDQHGHISSLSDPGDLDQWHLIDNIDVVPWDSRFVSPPEDSIGLSSAPQDSVLPSGPTPANKVSHPPEGSIDLLSDQDSQSIVGPTSPTLQLAQLSELPVCPGSTPALEDSHQPDCRCPQPVVFLIDELEAGQDTVTSQGLDAGLASHKEALRYGRALLDCQRFRARPEHTTILKFLTDKLAGLSEQIVAEYTRRLLLNHTAERDPSSTGPLGR